MYIQNRFGYVVFTFTILYKSDPNTFLFRPQGFQQEGTAGGRTDSVGHFAHRRSGLHCLLCVPAQREAQHAGETLGPSTGDVRQGKG